MSTLLKFFQARTAGAPAGPELEQRRRLQLALAVLVIALFVVVVRDIRDLQPPAPVPVNPVATTTSEPTTPPPAIAAAPPEATKAPARPETARRTKPLKTKQARVQRPVVNAAQSVSGNELSAGPTIIATDRAILPPLQIEVVAGNHRRPLAPASNSVKVDMQSGLSPETPAEPKPITEAPQTAAAPQVSLSPDVTQHVAHSVEPNYPLLAKQMKVQGAVVLEALIDKGGKIQTLRVLSGPAILAAAAQEAVKQWRFKPYYQGGQPVETEARVSVNFTISTF